MVAPPRASAKAESEQSLLIAILRQHFIAYEQESGTGASQALVAVDELIPQLQVYLGELGSEAKERNRIVTLLDQLKGMVWCRLWTHMIASSSAPSLPTWPTRRTCRHCWHGCESRWSALLRRLPMVRRTWREASTTLA